jgi:hypothetical protein
VFTNLTGVGKINFKIFYPNINENITYQNLRPAIRAACAENLILLGTYIRKEERSKINHPSFHPRKREKE